MATFYFTEIPLEGYQNYRVNKKGEVLNTKTGKILKSFPDKDGYQIVTVYLQGLTVDGTNIQKSVKVHRLVGVTFVPNPEGKKQINHKDGNKSNNLYTNIEWVTQHENASHAAATGLYCVGERSPLSKLTENSVKNIKRALRSNVTPLLIAEQYGITRSCVYEIKNNKTWKHVKL